MHFGKSDSRLIAGGRKLTGILLVFGLCFLVGQFSSAQPVFSKRGYYMTFMRMPTFGLREWKQMLVCLRQDGGNHLILWMGGGFKSKKFPITWKYNAEHKNIRRDFVSELIREAHKLEVKVLLAFTPFAYDGVNQYTLEHPELKATDKEGKPAKFWGMHSWGYNLCPSKPESQNFMLEYAREMFFEFYPEADGIMIESSDYAICFCKDCGDQFFAREFRFVRQFADEIWARKPAAEVLVYPHYFSGKKVPGFEVIGTTNSLDPRFTLFFTPHSAHIDPSLTKSNPGVFWIEGPPLATPWKVRDGAQLARKNNIGGFIPSLEPFSCVDGPPAAKRQRLKPFHFPWLADGQMPLNELLVMPYRVAYRAFSTDPEMSDQEFKALLDREVFGVTTANSSNRVDDLLALHEAYFFKAEWMRPPPLLDATELRARAARENWSDKEWAHKKIEVLRRIKNSYQHSKNRREKEMARIAKVVLARWSVTP